jgi:redox-sensitive bicupin YhaK (pirin superfamily)
MSVTSTTAISERRVVAVDDPRIVKQSPVHLAREMIRPGQWRRHDPFLLMMEDTFQAGAFGWHPHRGIETITYVIDGRLAHSDNRGNSGMLGPGDIQFMTAGRGIVHVEQPPPGEEVFLLQLWLNLPAAAKMTEPRYQDLRGADMPRRIEPGAELRVFSGSSRGVTSDTLNHVAVTIVEARVSAGTTVRQDIPGNHSCFVHVVEGEGEFGVVATPARAGQTLWLDVPGCMQATDLAFTATTDLRILLAAAEPLDEPVAAAGPFVMNTEDQLREAYADYQAGKFDD